MSTDNEFAPPATRTPGETPTPEPMTDERLAVIRRFDLHGGERRLVDELLREIDRLRAAPSSPPSPAVTAPTELGVLVEAAIVARVDAYRDSEGYDNGTCGRSDMQASVEGYRKARAELDAALSSLVEQTARAERERENAVLGDVVAWALTRAKSALENWGRHHAWCAKRHTVPGDCSCGYEQAIRDANDGVKLVRAAHPAAPTEEQTTHG